MAGDFYKQLSFIVGLSIFLTTMDSGVQTTLLLQNITSSLEEISFFVLTENSTYVNITVADAFTGVVVNSSLIESNNEQNLVEFSNLPSGSLFSVTVYDSNNETHEEKIATKPEAVKNLRVVNQRFTSAQIKWDYKPLQENATPSYLIYSTGIILQNTESTSKEYNFSKLSPQTTYDFSVSVFLYNLTSENKNGSFITLSVFPPNVTSIAAVNTSALIVYWTLSESSTIYPEYVDISSQNVTSRCLYTDKFCIIQVGQTPGNNHSLSIFSVQDNYTSPSKNFSYPTKPLPPSVELVSSNSTSLIFRCSPKSSFDYYLIDLIDNKSNGNNNKKILKKGQNVNVTFLNLHPNTGYDIVAATLSGRERSANFTKMFYTRPSLDGVTFKVIGNSVTVEWKQPDFENCSMCLYNDYNSSCNNIAGSKTVFENFKAGMKYLLNVSCYSLWSDPRQVIIPPLEPTNVNVSAGTHSIEISWEFDYIKTVVKEWFISIGGDTVRIPGNKTQFKKTNLRSGTDYNVSIWSFAENENSSAVTKSIRTYPECMTILSKVSSTNSSITLNLSETNNSFDKYEFSLQDQNGSIHTENVSKNMTTATFLSLEAGVKYDISVKTVSGDYRSESCDSNITARTYPNPPIVKCKPGDRNIYVLLTKGQGEIDGFEVNCTACANFTSGRYYSNGSTNLNITRLTPNEIYLIMVRTFAGDLWSENVSCNSTTNESAPSEVLHLEAKESKKNVINLTWNKPENENGYIRWYIVETKGTEVGTNESIRETFNSSKEFYELKVRPGYSYNVSVSAFTVAQGPAKMITFTTKTYAPGFKPNLTEEMKTPSKSNQIRPNSFTVEFPRNPFLDSDENGRILNYTVIVSTSNEPNKTQSSVLPNWYQFDKNSSIDAYQVISNCTNLYQVNNTCNPETIGGRTKRSTEEQSVKFKIGVNDCSKEGTSYCNGYLKPDTNYYVKVRAYTQDAYQDTPFSVAIRTKSEETIPSYAIALAVLCPLVTLFFAGLAFYMVRNKKALPKTKAAKDVGHMNMSRYKPTSHPVRLSNFKEHVARMSSDSDFRFAEEYEDLKDVGKGQEMVTAQLTCNRNKNRFANILPYDQSRVKLSSVDDEEGSDYINANYLPGFSSRREYIVTQGPLCSTRDDFWRMISEQNVHNIVMLTRCVEKLREKCDHYWPESGDPIFYGDVQVAKMHETITPDWTITEFKITIGERIWKLRHFHFTSWPDFGVPTTPQVLVNFVQTVRRSLIKTGPIVVHCSAGVGRSGTFIAVDHCMQHIQAYDNVDVLRVVHDMRMHRVLMVQTEQQYIYIHYCLLNALETSENEDIYQNVTTNQNGGHDNQAFLEDDEGIHVA